MHYCPFKKISPNKLIWVPKGTMINSMQHDKQYRSIFEAPKSKWVPKNYPFLQKPTPSQARSKRWYLDSGCSRHMTGDPSQFSKLTSIDEGYVTFGDNNKGKIIGKGTIGNKSNFFIEDVLLVDGLKHNLLSISQLCDKGYIVRFESNACIIEKAHKNTSMIALKLNNVYTIDINDLCNEMCFSVLNEDAWL